MGRLDGKLGYVRYCETCGKQAYCDRKAARRVARTMHNPRPRPYQCLVNDQWWHLGRNPQAVALGVAAARDVYRKRPA